ncbi:hypothetical protein NOK12_20650 [Nocardioides sp. OK12]|nr:hypothetical protein NOK12_20650 [Nocardioides sp. OK12]
MLALAAIAGTWYFQVKVPHDEVVAAFEEAAQQYEGAVSELEARNAELGVAISDLQKTIDSEQPPLNSKLLVKAGATIGEVQGDIATAPPIPPMPESTEKIRHELDRLPALVTDVDALGNYEEQISRLADSKAAIEASIRQMQQITNPSEQFVIQRIGSLQGIAGVQAVTEGNDPNGNLNKQGGYTATVYFSSTLVNQASVFGRDIVDKGTEGGGAIEVYRNVKDAKARNSYLASFDGGPISSGSHKVVGTVVVRTSDKLTASQQDALENSLRKALIKLI